MRDGVDRMEEYFIDFLDVEVRMEGPAGRHK